MAVPVPLAARKCPEHGTAECMSRGMSSADYTAAADSMCSSCRLCYREDSTSLSVLYPPSCALSASNA